MVESDPTVEYRDIPGFRGYSIGSDGSVWTCIERRCRKGRIGYESVITGEWKPRKVSKDRY